MSKFTGITFPLFAKAHMPVSTVYGFDTIHITEPDASIYIVDDKSINYQTYFSRLVHLTANVSKNTIKFDYTIRNMQELIRSPVDWGIDNAGKIFKFNKKELFNCKTVKIKKIKKNLIWAKTISYPFEITDNLTEGLNKFLFVTLVNVDKVWYLYEFSYKNSKKKEMYI